MSLSLSGSTLTGDPSDPSCNHLAVGDHTTITVTYDVTDAQGAIVQQTETVTITGTNDGPEVAAALTSSADEGTSSNPQDQQARASEPDDGETATQSDTNVSYQVDGGSSSATAPSG